MSRFWNERLSFLSPYIPGEQPKNEQIIKLNTNENPYGPSPKVRQAVQTAVNDTLRLYPDPLAVELRQAIARRNKLTVEQVFVGNGSDEVLALSFMAFFSSKRKICFPNITYSFYQVYANLFGIPYTCPKLSPDFQICLEDYMQVPGGVLIANPNAPTGILLSCVEIEQLLQQNPDCVVIVDEAYIDFGGESAVSLIPNYENLLVVQTFSKSRALAGLRIGFAMGHPALIQGLEIVKNSFNSYPLDRLALVAGKASIKDELYFQSVVQKIIQTREWTVQQMVQLGFTVLPSQANFIFVTHPKKEAKTLFLALREQNIFVRYFAQELLSDYLRITIGTQKEMEALIATLKTWMV